jgi:L-threonylcarbamoyladenylate synthase
VPLASLAGGVIAYPTEAVFGLAACPKPRGRRGVLAIKRRPWRKGLLLIGSDLVQLERFVVAERAPAREVIASWPGPVTWVLPATPHAPSWISGGRQRRRAVTDHPLASELRAESTTRSCRRART